MLMDLLETTGAFYCDDIRANGSLSLVSARVGNQVTLSRSHFTGITSLGYSLQCDTLTTKGAFYAEFCTLAGGVSLTSAVIGEETSLKGTETGHVEGRTKAFIADYAELKGDVTLSEFVARGDFSWRATQCPHLISLDGIRFVRHIPGELTFVVDFGDSHVRRLALGNSIGNESGVRIRLDGGNFERLELGTAEALPLLVDTATWSVGTFIGPVTDVPRALINWVAFDAKGRQTWYELASFLQRVGKPDEAASARYRAELFTTKSALSSRRLGAWFGRLLSQVTTGYGLYPLRTLGWLLVFAIGATLLAHSFESRFGVPTNAFLVERLASHYGSAAQVPPWVSADECHSDTWPIECFDPVKYGFATAFPIPGQVQQWILRDQLEYAFIAIRGVSWALTALLLAGITGLLRRRDTG